MRGYSLFGASIALCLAFIAAPGTAQPQSNRHVVAPLAAVQTAETLDLALNKSQVLRTGDAVSRIAVGNSDIVDAVALTDHSFYVLGKSLGATNVSIYGAGGKLLAVIDVMVGIDLDGIKSALHDILPESRIEVRAVNDAIALSGTLDGAAKVSRAVEIAKRFAGDKVINDLRVNGSQQVMLQVKVAEMQRNFTRALGFRPFAQMGNGARFSITSGNSDAFNPLSLNSYTTGLGQVVSGSLSLGEIVDLLETKGAVKILAEPNLTAMSGDTANFLAGGEFPVPVAQTLAGSVPTVTVEFKPFGVSLAFTPTVLDNDVISLLVAPEVSEIDRSNAVTFAGFTIPGISTRRAKTSIELRDGQSFAIAGLLSSDFTDTLSGIPGMMDIPVLGALARSSAYQRNETELVIIITPHLVQPVAAAALLAPTDSFVPPSDAQMFLMGRSENPDSSLAPKGGGLIGNYGHIIR
jgi:pilus assembly protein CpaC